MKERVKKKTQRNKRGPTRKHMQPLLSLILVNCMIVSLEFIAKNFAGPHIFSIRTIQCALEFNHNTQHACYVYGSSVKIKKTPHQSTKEIRVNRFSKR